MTMPEAYSGRDVPYLKFTMEHARRLISVELQFQKSLVAINQLARETGVGPEISTPHVIRYSNGGIAKPIVHTSDMQRVIHGKLSPEDLQRERVEALERIGNLVPLIINGEVQKSYSHITFQWPESELSQIQRNITVSLKEKDGLNLIEVSACASSCPGTRLRREGKRGMFQEFYRNETIAQLPFSFNIQTMEESLTKAIGTVFGWSAGDLTEERMRPM